MNPTLGVQEGCQLQCTLRRDPVELSFMSHPSILSIQPYPLNFLWLLLKLEVGRTMKYESFHLSGTDLVPIAKGFDGWFKKKKEEEVIILLMSLFHEILLCISISALVVCECVSGWLITLLPHTTGIEMVYFHPLFNHVFLSFQVSLLGRT